MASAAASAALVLLRGVTPRRVLRIHPPCIELSYCPPERRAWQWQWQRQQHQQPDLQLKQQQQQQQQEGEEEEEEPQRHRPPLSSLWAVHPEYRKWKDKEAHILSDVEPTISLAKDILHSPRYKDGEQLSDEDKKVVIEKILAYHPHSEDKIGCGLYSIMVDRHPEFKNSRCLFVVRTDGGWIDFSYQKCLRAYIRQKYPLDAERFIKEHFKRT